MAMSTPMSGSWAGLSFSTWRGWGWWTADGHSVCRCQGNFDTPPCC